MDQERAMMIFLSYQKLRMPTFSRFTHTNSIKDNIVNKLCSRRSATTHRKSTTWTFTRSKIHYTIRNLVGRHHTFVLAYSRQWNITFSYFYQQQQQVQWQYYKEQQTSTSNRSHLDEQTSHMDIDRVSRFWTDISISIHREYRSFLLLGNQRITWNSRRIIKYHGFFSKRRRRWINLFDCYVYQWEWSTWSVQVHCSWRIEFDEKLCNYARSTNNIDYCWRSNLNYSINFICFCLLSAVDLDWIRQSLLISYIFLRQKNLRISYGFF
jgi:hypothetical protein